VLDRERGTEGSAACGSAVELTGRGEPCADETGGAPAAEALAARTGMDGTVSAIKTGAALPLSGRFTEGRAAADDGEAPVEIKAGGLASEGSDKAGALTAGTDVTRTLGHDMGGTVSAG
jgi:hypothetical protein